MQFVLTQSDVLSREVCSTGVHILHSYNKQDRVSEFWGTEIM